MKTVKITIVGDLLAVDYCSLSLIDEENSFWDQYYLTCGWDKITAMYVDGNEEENVVKKKGKYVKTVEYWHGLVGKDSEHPLPCEFHGRIYCDQEINYEIKLEDDEGFDIKKVQLVKSDYELEQFPYFIVADYILYDGKEIRTYETGEYCPEEKIYDTFTTDEFWNGEHMKD